MIRRLAKLAAAWVLSAALLAAPAGAQFVPGMSNPMFGAANGTSVAAAATITATYVSTNTSTSDLTTYTFAAQNIGTAASNRKVVVGVVSRQTVNITVSTLTVGGVSATAAVNSSGDTTSAAIWVADVPTGATGDIVVTYNTGTARCAIIVWAMYGAGSSTPTNSGTSAANPTILTTNINAGGAAFGVAYEDNSTSFTWNNLTEDVDSTVETHSYSGGHATFVSPQTSLALTGTAASSSKILGAFAVFGP